ncbi:MAG: hypothetical protein IKP19_08670 [Oscillospiraceae bacterium]|nr:hypothetical protein [Oscillospiraceae bacterium]
MHTRYVKYCCAAAILLVVLLLTLTGCHGHKIEHLVYTDDYPTMYEAELRQIFGDYTLGPRTDRHIEGEDCSCGYHQDTVDCYEWDVTYTDALGKTVHCTLNNRASLWEQQVGWLEDQIEKHFYSSYVQRYYSGMLSESGSYCFCFIGRVCGSIRNGNAEEAANVQTGTDYLEALKKNEEPIPLAALSYPELFDRYPMRLSVQVRLREDNQTAEQYASAVELLNKMAAEMAGEVGNDLNFDACVYRDANHQKTVYYLRGEATEISGFDFDHEVFRSYKGKFW